MLDAQPIKDLLDALANEQAKIDLLKLDHDTYIQLHVSPEQWQAIKRARTNLELQVEQVEGNIREMKEQVAQLVLQHGESVAGQYLVAKWCKPRVKWNDDGLVGYSLTHPEIKAFRVVGEPSVTIAFKQQRKEG